MPHSIKHTLLRMGYRTEVGRVRERNEDSLGWSEPDNKNQALDTNGWLYVVADGMGGHAAGEVASKIAIDVVVQEYQASHPPVEDALNQAIHAANLEIFHRNRSGAESGMGTTIVCAVIFGDKLYCAHVGDSRAYLLRNSQLSPLTRDHSLVNDLLRSGTITPEEAQDHPQRHVLSRALGKKAEVLPEITGPMPIYAGDMILLCTDGISGYLDDDQISYLLQANSNDPQVAATALIQNADAEGGEDNATAIVVKIEKVIPVESNS